MAQNAMTGAAGRGAPRAARESSDVAFQRAVKGVRGPLAGVFAISLVANILMLTGPMFMMLVYENVIQSRSIETLVGLSVLALGLYLFYGLLELLRGKLLSRVGARFDHVLAPRLFATALRLPLHLGPHAKDHDPLQDLATIRGFMLGGGPVAFFDLPWIPIYLVVLYAVHPVLGYASAAGATLLVILSITNRALSRSPSEITARVQTTANAMLADAKRNAEAAAGMSMGDDLCKRWAAGYLDSMASQQRMADHASLFGALSKTARYVLQSAILAIGAYLVIVDGMSEGAMIACSVILARALAPVEQSIAQWRGYSAASISYGRLKRLAKSVSQIEAARAQLPRPKERLTVRDLAVAPPAGSALTLAGVNFELEAGDALGVIGPSGCGKSTLARALVGAWPAHRGEVRLDGALLSHYTPEDLGQIIGYLPQDVELFDGTVAENIARFRDGATDAQVIAAAKAAGVHAMILELAEGYETPIGVGGATLSGGQRQRIGLARALFDNPFLVVLDEPNSNLDPSGEDSLNAAVERLRADGRIVVVIAHRPTAIFACTKILSLRRGRAEMFGPKDQVLAALFPRPGQPHKPAEPRRDAATEAAMAAAADPRPQTAPQAAAPADAGQAAQPQQRERS